MLDQGEWLLAVGDEGEVAPVRPKCGLRADQAGAAYDQSPLAQFGLGDLGQPGGWVVCQRLSGMIGGLVDRVFDVWLHRDTDRVADPVAVKGADRLV